MNDTQTKLRTERARVVRLRALVAILIERAGCSGIFGSRMNPQTCAHLDKALEAGDITKDEWDV